MTQSEKTPSRSIQWVEEYKDKRQVYERYCKKLHALTIEMLDSEGIDYHAVESRAKSIESFTAKLERDGNEYNDPLNEFFDLVGIRIILYYADDVRRVCNLVDQQFDVDKGRSVDKLSTLAPDQFGYLSVHKVVKLSTSRTALLEWKGLENRSAEIQIRTVLQHSWASISHALQYKRENDIPYEFRRRLMRISGLLELADEEFTALREHQANLRREISSKVLIGDFEISIDALSVKEFLQKSGEVKKLKAIGKNVGFGTINENPVSISKLVLLCQTLEILSIKSLDELLRASSSGLTVFLNEFFALRKRHSPDVKKFHFSGAHVVSMVVVATFANVPEAGKAQEFLEWDSAYLSAVVEAGRVLPKCNW